MRVGLAGLGYWGPNLARVLSDLDSVQLEWLCDLDEDRLTRYTRRLPAARATTDFSDLLADDTLDAIFIATPVFTHFELASRSLAAGKHTFVEKPLAASADEASELVALAAERDLRLMCGHTFLFSPPVNAIKDLLDAGDLGDLYFISSSRVNLGLHQRDVSVVWDLGPHDFSILLHWLGELPVTIRATGRDSVVPGIPDVAFIALTYASGLVVNVELSWLAPSKLRRTVIVGSEKMVVYADGTPEPVRIYDSGVVYSDPESFGEYQLSYRTGEIRSPHIATTEPLTAEVTEFLAQIRSSQAPSHDHAALARDVVLLVELTDQSLREGGTAIDVPRSRVAPRS